MSRVDMDTYIVTVRDPENDERASYPTIRAVSAEHAERQAKGRFTGLDPDWREIQDRLEVKVVKCPK